MTRHRKPPIEALAADVVLAAPDRVADLDIQPPAPEFPRAADRLAEIGKERRDAHRVASNIRNVLLQHNLTLENLAARLDTDVSMLRFSIAGEAPIPIDLLWRIARALAVPFGTLVQSPVESPVCGAAQKRRGSKGSSR